MTGLWLYIAIGFLYVLAEYRLFANEELEEGTSGTLKFLYCIQMINHLLRAFTVWPMYVLEDMIVFFCTLLDTDQDDIDAP